MAAVESNTGFDFSNVSRCVTAYEIHAAMLNALTRNSYLADHGVKLPNATSTGTTIVGCLFEGGIVLGADTRATEGPIVADKNCEKVRS